MKSKAPRISNLKRYLTQDFKKKFHYLILICSAIALLDISFPPETDIEYAPYVKASDGTPLYSFLTRDQQWRMYTPLNEITPALQKAIVFKEDKYFYYHFGINPIAVGRALVQNIFHFKITSGASTITMQVARMLNRKKRTYANKIIEMCRALQLEAHYSKKEILQMYLNLVPYGSNIQGVKSAAILYFNKTPDQLSLAELTALSIIPNRPNALVIGKDNTRIVRERDKWLIRFQAHQLFKKEIIDDALTEPLMAQRRQTPQMAPQLAWRMRWAHPNLHTIPTTINTTIQEKAESLVQQYVNGLKLHNIHNAAVIVINNKSRAVEAYIGSSDFHDIHNHGQVDGVKAVRSPGSTLKPLLYGLAFDDGIATPKTMLNDVPTDFGGYIPENFDLDFRGSISTENALRQSLNIPAVKVLQQVGTKNFINSLHEAGFQNIWQQRKKLGLSMILGGCGVRLDELTTLFCAFANNGLYQPLQWTTLQKPQNTDTVRILSSASNYMITQIMKELRRPDFPSNNISATHVPNIAWKTGTSYGRRDAWSIGFDQNYTIGVWIGNFSGIGAPEINGALTATPLLFQLFNSITNRATRVWQPAPESIGYRLVCAETGLIPNTYCSNILTDSYIPGVSNNKVCEHLKEVPISLDERLSYCTSCLPTSGYKLKNFINAAPELLHFYDARNIPYESIPEHNPSCQRFLEGKSPSIISLTDGATYIITDKGKQELPLKCAVANDVQTVYWYINDQFIGSCPKNESLLFIPQHTAIKISCTDDKGRTTNLNIKLKYI
jgi:penicillin-binding protein 1C